MQQYIDRTLNICRTLNQNAKISTRFFRIESKYRRKHHRDSVWNTTTLVVALVNLWTTVGFFPSVVFPWLLRSSVHTSAYIRRPRDTRRRGIMRERESIERQTGESRRELDIARSGLLLLRMKVHMSPLSRCLRCHSRCWCAKRSLIALLRYAVKGIYIF